MKTASRIRVKNFMNSAFKEFSLHDNVRSVPTIFDGLKPSQRKALYGVQLRGERADELQVERLATAVAAATDYHHGAGSMASTIIGMANNYPGTNNLNLFIPSGQFGSRLSKESAAARYIFTSFSPNFRKVFRKEDDAILVNKYSDGSKIEPEHYLPILPMMLVNGAQGTGTGHACVILNYHPDDIVAAVQQVLKGKKLVANTLVPWFRGFNGTVQRNKENGQVVISGKMEIVNSTTIRITELPIGTYLDQYKAVLNSLEEDGFIRDYVDSSTEEAFDFLISVPRTTTALSEEELFKRFKLVSRDTENFTLWNEKGILERFDSAEAVVERFVEWRTGVYEVRRQAIIKNTESEIENDNMRIRFINFYLSNTGLFKNTGKAELIKILLDNDFPEYEKLLSMQMWNLTRDKIEELKKGVADKKQYLATVKADTAATMFTRELKEFKYAD